MFHHYSIAMCNCLLQNVFEKVSGHLEPLSTTEQLFKHISVFDEFPIKKTTSFYDAKAAQRFVNDYCENRKEFFEENSAGITHLIAQNHFDTLLEGLYTLNSKAYDLCILLLKIIVIQKLNRYIEGINQTTLGIAHIDYKSHYVAMDFYELIIHQITHTILYLEDLAEPHMQADKKLLLIETPFINKREGNAFSAYILFHSVIVGLEVMLFRISSQQTFFPGNYHGDTDRLLKRCNVGINLLTNHIKLFTHKGKDIIYHYVNICNNLTNQLRIS